MKPLIQALAVIMVVAALGPTLTFADSPEIENGLCTYYGTTTDGYLGKRHAASWRGQTCLGFLETVNDLHFGVATRSRAIPFCTQLELQIIDLPKWARPELNDLVGNTVTVTVIDRLPWDAPVDFDLWPAAFAALADSSIVRNRLGVCEVSVRTMKTREQVLLEAELRDGYATFIMAPHRLSSAQVALGSQWHFTQIGIGPRFKLIWIRETKELVAVEISAQTGYILPRGIEIFEHPGRYLLLGKFLEDEIAQLRQAGAAGGTLEIFLQGDGPIL